MLAASLILLRPLLGALYCTKTKLVVPLLKPCMEIGDMARKITPSMTAGASKQ